MKRMLALLLVLCVLGGCTGGNETYVAIEPHDENYAVSMESDVMTVGSFLSLKNAILRLVEEAVEEGVIRAESYTGDLAKDLSSAVYEVSRGDPLGAFAVDYMTYDYSQIVGYYEIHIHTTYRRSLEEIQSIQNASGPSGVRDRIRGAMETYQPVLRLRVSDYRGINVEEMTEQVFLDHPEFALERPAVETAAYPESGSSRILEVRFDYLHSQETLTACRDRAEETAERLALLYGSQNSDGVSARRLMGRLLRDGTLRKDQEGYSDSVYGALCEGTATAYGYAQAYLRLLEERNIPCWLVEGTCMGESHVWCGLTIDGEAFFADPVRGLMGQQPEDAIFPEEAAADMGYLT